MVQTRLTALLGAACLVFSMAGPVRAAEVEAGDVYCFSAEDFSGEGSLSGICITSLSGEGTFLLGDRILRPGDILTAGQVDAMTFCPGAAEGDGGAEVGYLPVFGGRVAEPSVMTIGIRGREDKAPVAEDTALETYKNLPAAGKLKVTDPEGQALTFTVIRQPRRGTLTVAEDGSFTYTPKKNKVGIDSFTFTAADPAGKVSREATVTVTILKPSDTARYTDTIGRESRFAAEWMRHTGIFAGEQVAENPCFSPDAPVSRGEFVTMLVKALDIPTDPDLVYTGYSDDVPKWLQPYLAAAVRAGLTAGLSDPETFRAGEPITGSQAAVMLQNALDLSARTMSGEEYSPLSVLAEHGIALDREKEMTREDTALALYRAVKIREDRPEMV